MATITIRNIPNKLVNRTKSLAEQKGISMEQEVRDLLKKRYAQREQVLTRIRQQAETLLMESESRVQSWKTEGRS
jgi:antitoxin FitA